MNKLVVAGGCFWGMQDLFRKQIGVKTTRVGYTGGQNDNPTYDFHPGHAEALEVEFYPDKTSEAKLLDYFFKIHDPTTLNRQGNDVGTSYRSAIFYKNEHQKQAAVEAISRASHRWQDPIVTSIEPLSKFWEAEDYHQDYLRRNPGGYTCHYER